MSETIITIRTNQKFRPLAAIYAAAWMVGVIGIGIWAESGAMQWVGFLVLILMGVGTSVASSNKDKGLTIAQARERLDQIAAKEAPHDH